MGDNDVVPLVDVTIQECTRWRWFEGRSKCTELLRQGWNVSGGDLLLDMGKHRTHLFVKRGMPGKTNPVITDIRVSKEHPGEQGTWESRPGGIWITRRLVSDIHEAITAIDFVHGNNVRELRRGRNFAAGGHLLLGKDINLSCRKGKPPVREYPRLKIVDTKPYKVLQVAGTIPPGNFLIIDLHLSTGAVGCRDVVSEAHKRACEADSASLKFLEYILDSEKPNFVAFTGDQVNGDSAPNARSVLSLTCISYSLGNLQVR